MVLIPTFRKDPTRRVRFARQDREHVAGRQIVRVSVVALPRCGARSQPRDAREIREPRLLLGGRAPPLAPVLIEVSVQS